MPASRYKANLARHSNSCAWPHSPRPAQRHDAAGMSTSSTLFIQAMDLGIVVPMMIVAAVQLLQRRPFGYLLTSTAIVKFVTMGLALDAMIAGQYLAGVPMAPAEIVIFPLISVISIGMAVIVLRAVRQEDATQNEFAGGGARSSTASKG